MPSGLPVALCERKAVAAGLGGCLRPLTALFALFGSAVCLVGCGRVELPETLSPTCEQDVPFVSCIVIHDVTPETAGEHFEPSEIEVPADTMVVWSYSGFQNHDLKFVLTQDDGQKVLVDDPDCPPPITMSYHCSKVFSPGTYEFICSLHQSPALHVSRLIVREP